MAYKFVQGKFLPNNIGKYKGDPYNCIYRSSWERVAFQWLDSTPEVLAWCSEEEVVPYVSPLDNRIHRYFVDLKATIRTASGPKTFLIEIKPLAQTKKPKKTASKREDVFIRECATYAVNQAKWEAAEAYCKSKGWEFIKWTEKQLQASQPRYKRKA